MDLYNWSPTRVGGGSAWHPDQLVFPFPPIRCRRPQINKFEFRSQPKKVAFREKEKINKQCRINIRDTRGYLTQASPSDLIFNRDGEWNSSPTAYLLQERPSIACKQARVRPGRRTRQEYKRKKSRKPGLGSGTQHERAQPWFGFSCVDFSWISWRFANFFY